jgi:hypothetical protein
VSVQPGGSNRTPSRSVRSLKMFWKVKYWLSAGVETRALTPGCLKSALISEAKRNVPLPS